MRVRPAAVSVHSQGSTASRAAAAVLLVCCSIALAFFAPSGSPEASQQLLTKQLSSSAVAATSSVLSAGKDVSSSKNARFQALHTESSKRLTARSLSLPTSNVDFATLPAALQYKVLHGAEASRSSAIHGHSKYDSLLSDGPGAVTTQALENVDLETLPPKVQLKALIKSHTSILHAKKSDDAPFDNLLSDGPLGTPHVAHSDSKGIKLGSRVGLDGNIKLLRSANQIIAERIERARESYEAAHPTATAPRTQSAPAEDAASDAGSPAETTDVRGSSDGGSSSGAAATAAASELSLEEAKLRDRVANLEKRAADAEMSEDQGLLGGPAPAHRRRRRA